MGLMFINNASEILPAYQKEEVDTTAFIAVISCFNGFGRLVYRSECEKATLPRPPVNLTSVRLT